MVLAIAVPARALAQGLTSMNLPPPNAPAPHVLIVGCGGIGGVIACSLVEAGVHLTIATTNPKVRNVWQSQSASINGRQLADANASVCIVGHPQEAGTKFDFAFVAVQPNQIEEVGASLKSQLKADGRVVCLPNGLCEGRLAAHVGDERVVGAVVAWGARMPEPGCYTRTSSGGFLLGAYRGRTDEKIQQIAHLLKIVGPVRVTQNLSGARFSKLVINCAVSALGTIGGNTLGQLLLQAPVRTLALSIMAEAVAVGLAEGIKLESVTRVDLAKLVLQSKNDRKLRKAAQHAILLVVGARYRNLRSSMLAAIEKGRAPAVDFINGEIVALGTRHGMPVPYNQAAQKVIWAIARGELQPGTTALRELLRQATNEVQPTERPSDG